MDGQCAPAVQQAPFNNLNMSEQQQNAAEHPDGTRQDPLSQENINEVDQEGVAHLTETIATSQQVDIQQAAHVMESTAGLAESQLVGAEVEPKRQICFDFTKNQCTRGAACKFSHDVGLIITVNSQEKGICFDFLKGLCTRGLLCRFSHDLRNLQTPQCTASSAKKRFAPICYDFVKNQCTRGEDCKYSHDYSSILYGPRAPGKDPYVICVDFTRGKCSRGASCRYSHVDARMLSGSALPNNGNVHPALLAAGFGVAAAAAAVAQANTLNGAGAMQGALAGLNAASLTGQAHQPSDLQAQAALLLSGLGSGGLLGSGLPSTPVAGAAIPAAWNSLSALPQTPEGFAALLEQLQRTALSDSIAQLSPTAGDAASLSALNALMGNSMSPTYANSLGSGDSLTAELHRNALAASLLQTPGTGLVGMLEQQQQQLYQHGADAALLQSQLNDASQLSGIPGSAPVSAAPTPTAAGSGMASTVFQQHRPSPPNEPLEMPHSAAPTMTPKSQPLMPVYHPLLQHKGGALAGAGMRADIAVDARNGESPTIPASWVGSGNQQQTMQHQSALAQQLKQQPVGLPPPPPPVHVSAPAMGEHVGGTPSDTPLPSSYDQMQMIWGQLSIWGQRQ